MPAIIFKPTEACNSACKYCDVVKRKKPLTLSFEMLEIVFIRLDEFLKEFPQEKITLIWHGGEPLLLGTDYFNKAITLLNRHCSDTQKRIEHAIQSNLTLLNQDFIEVFRKLGISYIGTSCEPLAGIRGSGADKKNSAQYNRLFIKGIRLLEKNDINFGIIYVVNRKSLKDPLKIFHYLANITLKGSFMMNPVLDYDGRSGVAITPEEYADFLGAIFPLWWQKRFRYPEVDPFKSFLANTENPGHSLGCVDSGNCAHSHIYIGPDGETSQCGRAGDWNMISYGNIVDHSLKDILFNPKREVFIERNNVLQQADCKDCRLWKICHGGCPLDAFSVHRTFLKKSNWCDAKRIFVEKYFEPITGYRFSS